MTLTINLPPELEAYLSQQAQQQGLSIEALALQLLTGSIPKAANVDDPLFLDDAVYQDDGPDDMAVNHDDYLYEAAS